MPVHIYYTHDIMQIVQSMQKHVWKDQQKQDERLLNSYEHRSANEFH